MTHIVLVLMLMSCTLVYSEERSATLVYCMNEGRPLRGQGLSVYRRGRYIDGGESRTHNTPLVALGT